MPDSPAAFILIDHTMRGEGGHFLEYARHVLDAARDAGMRPVLATNVAFAEQTLPYDVHRCFTRDVWGQPSVPFETQVTRPPRVISALRQTVLGKVVSHWERVEAFARGIDQLLREIRPVPRDVLFIPNLSESDLVGLLRAIDANDVARSLSWHLLFRREIYGSGPAPGLNGHLTRIARRYLLRRTVRRLRTSSDRAAIEFHTDTRRLAEDYRRVCGIGFAVLPIRVNPRLRPAARRVGVVLTASYVGDARAEKGYELLPGLIQGTMNDPTAPDFRTRIQSNVVQSDARRRHLIEARDRLRQLPGVEIIDDAIGSEAYAELVRESDVMLIPYCQRAYFARSSSVLVEALAAGVPVLVPAGSWMSGVLQPETAHDHDELLKRARNRATSLAVGDVVALQTGLDHLLVNVSLGHTQPAHVLVRARFAFAQPRAGVTDERLLSTEYDVTALFRIPPSATSVKLDVVPRRSNLPVAGARVDAYAFQNETPLPLEAMGRTYARTSHLVPALTDLLTHNAQYRARATEFSTRRQLHHAAEVLVTRLTGQATSIGSGYVETAMP